jgi:hypothetical protein
MAPKRKRTQTTELLYAADVPQLQVLINKPSQTMGDASGRTQVVLDPVINTSMNDEESVLAACKLVYLLYHNTWGILKPLGIGSFTYKAIYFGKKMRKRQTSWQDRVLNKFALPHVKASIVKWEAAHPGQSFSKLSPVERVENSRETFKTDSQVISKAMFKPLMSVLDTFSVFDVEAHEAPSEEDRKKMKAVRDMLQRNHEVFCEITYLYRILENNEEGRVRQTTSS